MHIWACCVFTWKWKYSKPTQTRVRHARSTETRPQSNLHLGPSCFDSISLFTRPLHPSRQHKYEIVVGWKRKKRRKECAAVETHMFSFRFIWHRPGWGRKMTFTVSRFDSEPKTSVMLSWKEFSYCSSEVEEFNYHKRLLWAAQRQAVQSPRLASGDNASWFPFVFPEIFYVCAAAGTETQRKDQVPAFLPSALLQVMLVCGAQGN